MVRPNRGKRTILRILRTYIVILHALYSPNVADKMVSLSNTTTRILINLRFGHKSDLSISCLIRIIDKYNTTVFLMATLDFQYLVEISYMTN